MVETNIYKEADGRHSFLIYGEKIQEAEIKMLTKKLDKIPDDKWISGQLYGHPIPRIVRWYQKDGGKYKFSGKKYESFEYEKWLDKYITTLNNVLNEGYNDRLDIPENQGFDLNSVLINKYRTGNDSISWHSDDEPEFGEHPTIVSISLGEPRTFKVRRMSEQTREKAWVKRGLKYIHLPSLDRTTFEYKLGNGSMLIMGGAFQDFWEHSIPKEENRDGVRYNLTFRPYKKV